MIILIQCDMYKWSASIHKCTTVVNNKKREN